MDADGLRAIFERALEALDPEGLVVAALDHLQLATGPAPFVVALGKAAAGMVRGAAAVWPDLEGIAVMPRESPLPPRVIGVVGDHPVPRERSLGAGDALLTAVSGVSRSVPILFLVSGGGSALAEAPIAGVSAGDLANATERLLASGASIADVNALRIAISRIKGGGLASVAQSDRLITLAISDIPNGDPSLIASGPTVAPNAIDPVAALRRVKGAPELPRSVLDAVAAYAPRSSPKGKFHVIADGATAARAAAAIVAELGEKPIVEATVLGGEARSVAESLAARPVSPGSVHIWHGETTVTVTGDGRGGRNHEAALAAALMLDQTDRVFLAAGTDGVDGTTDAAGAVVDGGTIDAARAAGIDAAAHLAANDSGGFFDRVPGRIATGPTGTNVADLWLYSATG